MSRCSIVPPHMLRRMADSGDERLAATARATLQLTEDRAAARQGLRGVATQPTTSTPFPPQEARGDASGPQRTVHDAGGTQTLPGEVVRGEGDPATGDEAADQAYDGLGETWALWQEEYGRNSLDGQGLPLLATVHYGQAYDNAFWDGSQMVFGDGDGEVFLSFTRSLDVIGHELAHGTTQYTSGLNYQGQSGALNEHVSDVFGVLVKQRSLGQDAGTADWLIGAELLADGVQGRALRSMAEPGSAYDDPRLGTDPQPGHMRDYVETTEDNGGVHINSGIPNKAFHVLATSLGGNAWGDPGRIWFDTITGDISADCDFVTFAGLTIDAATARFGEEAEQTRAVRQAWQQVGVLGGDGGGAAGPDGTGTVGQAPAPADQTDGAGGADGSAEVPAGAEVTVRRTGGVAGVAQERRVRLDEMPDGDARSYQSLLQQPQELQRMAAQTPQRPDGFCYGLTCEQPPLDVSIPEPVLPAETRSLFERTLRRDQQSG